MQVFNVLPWKPEPGVLLVILKEFPMTYICTFKEDGTTISVADSLVKLGRKGEVEEIVQKHLAQVSLKKISAQR